MKKSKRLFLFSDGRIEEREVEVIELSLREYNLTQVEWIKTHQYFLSKDMGYDVGFNYASQSWVKNGYAQNFRNQFKIKEN
jgi:ribulose bisphosphate carboxylase small subunit